MIRLIKWLIAKTLIMLDHVMQIDVRSTLFGMTVRIIVYCAVRNGESKSLCHPSPASSLHQWIIQLRPKLQMLRVYMSYGITYDIMQTMYNEVTLLTRWILHVRVHYLSKMSPSILVHPWILTATYVECSWVALAWWTVNLFDKWFGV